MLWQKGWLETRFRILFSLVLLCFILYLYHLLPPAISRYGAQNPLFGIVLNSNPMFVVMVCTLLAGAGIATQPPIQASKGLHGSMLFTLSLPVTRLRLLAVRVTIGWSETITLIATFCAGMWLLSPLLRTTVTPVEMVKYAVNLIVCGSALYFLSVLLATLLDDLWRTWGTMIAAAATGWISYKAWLPASIDIGQAITKRSPLIAHTMPWSAMAFAIALAAAFFVAALKIVQTRQY